MKRQDFNPELVAIGTRIRIRREELGLTQQELADAVGATRNTISRYEIGQSEMGLLLIVFNSSSIVNEIERKVRVTYWNDAINSYVENKMFYIPDTVYPIKKIVKLSDDEYDIVYRSIKLTLIEY